MSDVRVRFAPSPTGFFHIGSARTALFNWLYARHTGGKFLLRIEDTDKERNTEEALRVLLDGMRWLGLDWDEGPEIGGDVGPYFQSQRGDIYREHIQKLLDSGRAYEKDGAVWFQLEGERYTAYDEYKKAEVEKVKADPVVIDDLVRGRVERREEMDFVIVRSSGDPVFHLVNVIDDMTMGITHVIRGEDHLSNTPKHVHLFQAFGVEPPKFAHIPLILKAQGSGKMSKRDEGSLIEEYQRRLFIPEAVRNYLCLLGWSPKNDEEIMPIETIIERFDLPGINQTNARFDEKKLSFMNGDYTRALPTERFVELCVPLLAEKKIIDGAVESAYVAAVLALCQEKVRSIEDVPGFVNYFFTDDFVTDEKAYAKIMKKGDPLARLRELREALAPLDDWTAEALEAALTKLAEQTGENTGNYIHPGRLAVSGTNVGPGFYGMFAVLGKDRVLARIDRFLDANG